MHDSTSIAEFNYYCCVLEFYMVTLIYSISRHHTERALEVSVVFLISVFNCLFIILACSVVDCLSVHPRFSQRLLQREVVGFNIVPG